MGVSPTTFHVGETPTLRVLLMMLMLMLLQPDLLRVLPNRVGRAVLLLLYDFFREIYGNLFHVTVVLRIRSGL